MNVEEMLRSIAMVFVMGVLKLTMRNVGDGAIYVWMKISHQMI